MPGLNCTRTPIYLEPRLLLDYSPEVSALKSRLKDQHVVVLGLGNVVWQHIQLVAVGVEIFSIGGRVLAVVYDLVDEGLSEDDGLDLPSKRFFEYIVFGEVYGLVGIVGGVEFWLGG